MADRADAYGRADVNPAERDGPVGIGDREPVNGQSSPADGHPASGHRGFGEPGHAVESVADGVPKPGPVPALVPEQVTAAKLQAELCDWQANAEIYQRRGWVMLEHTEQQVDIAFVASVPLVGVLAAPVITACVRIDYTNYDLWPPSVTFIDPRTRQPAPPVVRAPANGEHGVRDALVENHPVTGLPFLCLPGIREYHSHPQHSGDDWLLHRRSGAGRIAVICERIWQRMVVNVIGLRVTMQAFPPAVGTELQVAIAQGDLTALPGAPNGLDAAAAQAQAMQAAQPMGAAQAQGPLLP
ncbi:UNVERIFIED_ORG: hypothetical protein E4P37_00030 [Bacillus sp. AZ43]